MLRPSWLLVRVQHAGSYLASRPLVAVTQPSPVASLGLHVVQHIPGVSYRSFMPKPVHMPFTLRFLLAGCLLRQAEELLLSDELSGEEGLGGEEGGEGEVEEGGDGELRALAEQRRR